MTVEGLHDAAPDDIDRALRDLQSLLGTYATPSAVRSDILDATNPVFAR